MTTIDPFRTSSSQLAPLFELKDEDVQTLWRPDELGAIWQHQITASFAFDLGGLNDLLAAELDALVTPAGQTVKTFAELLQHPNPPVVLLDVVKQFAKAHLGHPESL